MKPTQAQLWLIHSLEFYTFGAVFAAVVTIYGAFQTGTLTFASAGVILGTALTGLIANVYKGTLLNAATLQAVTDTFSELQQSHNAAAQQTGNALSHLTGLVTGLLHMTSNAQATPPTSTPPQLGGTWGKAVNDVPQKPFPMPVITMGGMPTVPGQ